MDLRRVIRDVPDFPKQGILFRDITPVLESPAAFRAALDGFERELAGLSYDRIAAMESRGFLFAGPLCAELAKPLVLLRKAGKLPRETERETYALEYGQATLEVHRDSIGAGQRVVIVDDLLATGGTALAAGRLVRKLGGEVAAFLFLIELGELGGRRLLTGTPVFSLVNYR